MEEKELDEEEKDGYFNNTNLIIGVLVLALAILLIYCFVRRRK